MERSKGLALVQPHLTKERYEHTIRVTDTALQLAEHYHESKKAVMLAAIFHDYAKYRDLDEMRHIIKTTDLPKELLTYHHELWHGPVGARLVQKEVGIQDEAILSAIEWHTTGKAKMSLMDKIIYLADYIEPGRDFPGLDRVRHEANNNIDLACFLAVKNTINYLLTHNRSIYPETLNMYNDLNRKLGD